MNCNWCVSLDIAYILALRWKNKFEEISFEIFTERGKTFTRFQCGWEFIPNDGCSNRESTLAQVQFSSGNRKLL